MLKLLPCLRGYNSSKKMIHFAHESEAAIDTFIMNIMQQNSESNSELHDWIQRFQKDIIDVKAGMQQVQVSQTYKEDTKSTETQANNSSSSSVSVKTRVRSFINEKRRMVGRGDEMEKLLDLLIEGQPFLSAISIWRWAVEERLHLLQSHATAFMWRAISIFVWVVVSWHYNPNQILEDILRSVLPSSHLSEIPEKRLWTEESYYLWLAEGREIFDCAWRCMAFSCMGLSQRCSYWWSYW